MVLVRYYSSTSRSQYYRPGSPTSSRNENVRTNRPPSSSSALWTESSSSSSSSWWERSFSLFSAVVLGVSAGFVTYHVCNKRREKEKEEEAPRTIITSKQRRVKAAVKNILCHLQHCFLSPSPLLLWMGFLWFEPRLLLGTLLLEHFFPLLTKDEKEEEESDERNNVCIKNNRTEGGRAEGQQQRTHPPPPGFAARQAAAAREEPSNILSNNVSIPMPASATTPTSSSSSSSTTQAPKRYVELLVHNVSHTDLVLSLEPTERGTANTAASSTKNDDGKVGHDDDKVDVDDDDDPYWLCRPRFSCFDKYSRLVQEQCRQSQEIRYVPRYRRAPEGPRFSIIQDNNNDNGDDDDENGRNEYAYSTTDAKRQQQQRLAATGLTLAEGVPVDDLHELRIRGCDQAPLQEYCNRHNEQKQKQQQQQEPALQIRHVFFPLLATLLPRWQEQIADKHYDSSAAVVKRVVILVSGVGTPRNWTHELKGNSTKACAQLMKEFLLKTLNKNDDDVVVVTIHSETNIFRYDENLVFVEKELMPRIHAYRDAHARGLPYPDEVVADETDLNNNTNHPFSTDWRKSFQTTLSFADGSPARTYAIQASLRPYRPTYFHFWQLKTFWHESKIVHDDIEVHSFEAMETSPAVDTSRCQDPNIQAVIAEMKAFRDEWTRVLYEQEHDIYRFWLRKTHKPVLAILLVQPPGMDKPILYRGTNMEVSMPTGSLCAERNVIGSALADRPDLKREDLKLIAVLAIPPPAEKQQLLLLKRSSGSTVDLLSQQQQQQSDRKTSIGSETEEWILPPSQQQQQQQDVEASFAMVPGESSMDRETEPETSTTTPLRRIQLFSKSAAAAAHKQKRTVVLQHSTEDLNPLRPCGACNEWLKKIAESNPYFKILTFTDADCNGVYVTPCQE